MIKQVLKAVIVSVVSCSNAEGDTPGSRVTWITPKPISITTKPTEAPTYDFPTETPVIQQSIVAGQSTKPPFFTTLPSKAPSLSFPTETPDNTIIEQPTISYGQSTESTFPPTLSTTSSSAKSGKSGKDAKALKIPPFIESPTYNPSEPAVFTSSPTPPPLCSSAKWHPDVSFLKCSNSLDYPEDWRSTPDMKRHFFRATLQQCCEFVFGLTGICQFEDVCSISSPTISPTESVSETTLPTIEDEIETANPSVQDSQSPSSSPSDTPVETLRPTVPTTSPTRGLDPLKQSLEPSSNVVCTCSPKEDVIIRDTSSRVPTESPTTAFPTTITAALDSKSFTAPPFYTSLPTASPAPPSSSNTRSYQIGHKDEDSSDFNGFAITTQKETVCSKVVDISEGCKLECVVTIKLLYRDETLIHEPTLVKYETGCSDGNI